jgi:hypothetical protein
LLVGSFGHAMTAAKTKGLSKKDADIFFCDGALKRQKMVPIDPWEAGGGNFSQNQRHQLNYVTIFTFSLGRWPRSFKKITKSFYRLRFFSLGS